MNILFVCSRNKWRSATAEKIYQNHLIHQVKSAGTAAAEKVKIIFKHIDWADLIFVMEKKHKQIIKEKFAESLSNKEIIILNIPDEYQYMDEELISEIKAKVSTYL
jgi:protein-tyrosine phosphatase